MEYSGVMKDSIHIHLLADLLDDPRSPSIYGRHSGGASNELYQFASLQCSLDLVWWLTP
jgi:hypothetical protein